MLSLRDFDYPMPQHLIAQQPAHNRDEARLMIVDRATGSIQHSVFHHLPDFLNSSDLLVANDTKVAPCRLVGRKATGGKVEVLLVRHLSGMKFEVLIGTNHPLKQGQEISFNNGSVTAVVSNRNELTFSAANIDSIRALGMMPLPPYIKRAPCRDDDSNYQTVYAQQEGSIAAPTAGLHFTPGLLDSLKTHGMIFAPLTLHIGYATFKQVECEDVTQHPMHCEEYSIPQKTRDLLNGAHCRVVAVGTTAVRTLEAYATTGVSEGSTDIFIYPGYTFRMTDVMITNFHLPRTTLFILVCAFAGTELMKKAYQVAIEEKYRFYSYGDAMLIL